MIAAVISILLMAGSQLLFKGSMIRLRRRYRDRIPPLAVLFFPWVIFALLINVISALLWIWALRNLEISYLYPLLCANYLLVPLGARAFLGEPVGRRHWVAIGVICAGVFLCLLSGNPGSAT